MENTTLFIPPVPKLLRCNPKTKYCLLYEIKDRPYCLDDNCILHEENISIFKKIIYWCRWTIILVPCTIIMITKKIIKYYNTFIKN